MKTILRAGLLIFTAFLAVAQTAPGNQAFEVASVKRAAANAGGPKSIDLQQVRYTGFTLRSILQDAYKVKRYQINGPDWLDTQHYDIVAKLPDGASKEQIPAMLQDLLAERFRMKVHEEIRRDRIYALVIAKNGPHLTRSKDDATQPVGLEVHGGHIEFVSATLDSFSSVLSSFLGRPVLDMTGIQGHFDIILITDNFLSSSLAIPNTIPDTNFSSSILAAMPELGLKLESRTAPLRHIVVDSAEKIPTGN